jgi:malonyl CoA-acyl carrier protein transacylase
MLTENEIPVLAFVWRPGDLSRPVCEMAQRTGTRAIFDLSEMSAQAVPSFLKTADPAGQIRDIKLSAAAFMDLSVGRLLKEAGVRNIWVECHPQLFTCEPSALFQRLRDLSADFRCFPIVGDVSFLAELVKAGQEVGSLVLKGCEAAGLVSGETSLALYGAAKQLRNAASASPDLLIWGGVATPEAAAAFLSTGAAGIVFESLHWLTDLVAMDDLQRQQLARMRMDSTALVGLDLQVPCRLFNKGNSLAFKRIQALEDALCAAEIADESRRAFARQVQAVAVHPLDSHFTPGEVIPLGVEAAFAASFAERFGAGTEQAVKAFVAEVREACGAAEAKRGCFLDSPVARELGLRYPFIQGAMSSITDSPEYAAAIADAGGLPTLALGLMDAQAVDRRLGRLPELMGARPYAVNVVSLAENPFRETHLAWIKRHRPRFVWIAGGDLSPIRDLLQGGIGVVYIAPDEALLKLALEAGVRYVVFEGYEAGGHVGQHSALSLAQMALDLKRRQPALFEGCRVILAGGIFNRETAFMAGLLGADAVQMGTAYLATREIVETGALAPLYQRMIVESRPGGTVVSGQSTGLRVRSLRTPRAAAISALERAFAAGHQDEQSFRAKIEEMTAGSLCVAARGVDRQSGRELDEQACLERGQFMSGSCAGLIGKVQSLESFHRELAEGPLVLCQPFAAASVTAAAPLSDAPQPKDAPVPGVGRRVSGIVPGGDRDRVAITGMSVINALGKSPEEVWAACVAMKSGVTLVPPSRWDHDLFYDPRPRMADKTYCRVAAFVDFHVSRTELGIPPQDFRTMTTATRNTMWLAQNALRDSGLLESGIPRERIAVLISQNSGEAASTLTDLIMRGRVHEIIAAVKRAMPLTPEQESAIVREVKSERMAPDDTTLLGRLNCTAAGFICNRYGFMGPSYAVSAACATSLVALYSALQMIRNGVIDAALVGGSEETLTHLHFLEFSALGALYGLSGRPLPPHEASRPFDAGRDGLVLGEGGGMIVIERESLARTRGAPVHAVITGMGASNNHLGMVESSRVTQEIAMRASFRGLPYGPESVDLVECHGTSTRQGDGEEVRALSALYDPSRRTVLTSFKSQIGHTLGASGINNLIRGTMAMKAGVLPPTLNYRHPDPDIDLEGAGFRIAQEPCDWQRRAGQPRRFQVNAFGFGGSNYVVQVEQALEGEDAVPVSTGREAGRAAETGESPAANLGVSFFRTAMAGRTCRVAVVAASDEEALAALERSAALAEEAVALPKAARALAQQGLFLSPEDLPTLPLALVFPGQGAHYAGMGRALYEAFPVIREWMDRAAAAADFDLLHLLFHDREENLQKTRWQQPALFTLEYAVARHLLALGLRPVALAGHSLGELTALCLAGVYSLEDGFRIVNKRALCMDKAAAMHGDPGVMAATDAPLELLKEMLRGLKDVHIGNINSPGQIVLSGNTDAVKNLGASLKAKGHRYTLLRVSMAFHSPIMRVIHDELEAFVASIPFHAPQLPVISNTTREPYPSDPAEIRRILMAHLESPVHWADNVQTLWKDYGIRHFVEAGPGDVLSGLIADTLPEPLCVQTCLPAAESDTFRAALAQLFVHGHLRVRKEPRFVALSSSRTAPASRRPLDAPPAPAAPALSETPEFEEHLEAVIRIIMEATGFNRDEIQPDMDLRRDLSVRSSRLPIIMDAAEHQFKITIELEDFIHVRTVRDIAQRVSAIIARQEGPGGRPAAETAAPGSASAVIPEPAAEDKPLKRLIFSLASVEAGAPVPMEVSAGESALLLSLNADDPLAKRAGAALFQAYGVDAVPLPLMTERAEPAEARPAVGLVITLAQGSSERLVGMAEVSRLLAGLAERLKDFLQAPARKFVVLIHDREEADTPVRLLAEGLLGLFLSAAQEYPAVLFRTLEIDRDTDLPQALRAALDKGCATVQLLCRKGQLFTSQARLAPAVFEESARLALNPGDVVVMSGGASGISAHLARSLAPFAPRLVFLGRTRLEPHSETSRAGEIAQTLADLHAAGIEAIYLTCDVTDPEAVRAALGEVVGRYGRIDGIIHGAGVLRDGFLDQMTPEDFCLVVDIKVMGAWNLFAAAEGAGLRFFAGLSSVTAIQGNPGQTNYAAANRMLSALLRDLRRTHGAIRFKALMLPPVEGAGMAEAPEVRDLLRRRGVAYVHVKELAGLFCRELFVAPADDDWVMFIRTLPSVKTAPLGDVSQPAPGGLLEGGSVAFSPQEFPMIDSVTSMDLLQEQVEATRTFSRQNDLWLEDHRPLKPLAHPLVSAVMMVETFMESARLLYPHLDVRGARQVRFMDMISCPPEVPRAARVLCRRAGADLREVVCEASLSVQEVSPSGRLADRFLPHCMGQVLLGGSRGELPEGFHDFPVRSEELRTPPVSHEEVLTWYQERTGLAGRYRVLQGLDGAGPGAVRGLTRYTETDDFAHLRAARYQYSPYLFEALMQLAGFHLLAMNPQERRSMLPMEIGELRFLRPCRPGEAVTLEARLRSQDPDSLVWDAQGLDDQGRTLMQVRAMRMHWIM